ncbi:DUF2892 domain-containing protein [Bacillus tianshenii]|nr:DUF2892 domain-containing protein [Bacillus tianshenii]
MTKQNIGTINALMRITIGLTTVAWATAKMVRQPYCPSFLWFAMGGAMKVAEGITRYCPMVAAYEQMKKDCGCDSHNDSETNEHTVVNPS